MKSGVMTSGEDKETGGDGFVLVQHRKLGLCCL